MGIIYARSWNPWSGCSKVSEGCANCWAERQARRHHQSWGHVEITTNPKIWTAPLGWRDPQVVAVCFMGDPFHKDVPDSDLLALFAVMLAAQQHTFLLLTKRPERMRDRLNRPALAGWPDAYPNVWLGVSVENQRRADERLPILMTTRAKHRWASLEPLLGAIDLSSFLPCGDPVCEEELAFLDWVVVGGESGPGARPCAYEWIYKTVCQGRNAGVDVYVKQVGTFQAKAAGWADYKGEDMAPWPPELRVRQLPPELMAKGGTMRKGVRLGKEP